MRIKKALFTFSIAAVLINLVTVEGEIKDDLKLPDFICTVRAGYFYEDFQRKSMRELELIYVQGLVDINWINIQRGDDIWKWGLTDSQMDKLAEAGLKVIPLFLTPKLEGLHWDETIKRDNSRYIEEYGRFAYQVTKRYHKHPAWSGLVAVWGGSSDVFGEHPFHDPKVQVPLLNSAYDGIKKADPDTIVISFNLATTIAGPSEWLDWHKKAFALKPRFDWFGVQTHCVPPTYLQSPDSYAGVTGLINVRRFLDDNGYRDKPIWVNEGGFLFGEDIKGLSSDIHAEQIIQTYIIARSLDVNLRGWVYFEYFTLRNEYEDWGLMSSVPKDESEIPKPRKSWYALQTLIKTINFFDYKFDSRLSGGFNNPEPFVYYFKHKDKPDSKLWIIFSPRLKGEPIKQEVTINILPAKSVFKIDTMGNQTIINADPSGNVKITSTGSPVYLK